jgi:Predicted esterase
VARRRQHLRSSRIIWTSCARSASRDHAARTLLFDGATGDEVLDYREMLAHYPGARTTLIEGSDHAISEFAQYVDEVLAFCGAEDIEPPAPREAA